MPARESRPGPAASAALPIVIVLFVLSGAAGLTYEVIWIRSLTLIFGKTVHAASAVLVAFMAGLALGSAAGGRFVDRARFSPLKLYAMLEAGIGLWALLLPMVMAGVGMIYKALAGPFDHLPVWLSLVRFVLATAALMPATFCMGATLPALSRWAVRDQSQVGSRLGLLYALNTLGGVAGCLAAGFFLLEWLGLSGTTWAAVAGNLVVAALALALAQREAVPEPAGHEPAAGATEPAGAKRLWMVMTGVFLGGFAALALEVTWTRTLQLVFGSTTYSFSAMLSVFLTGIGIGSLLMTPLAPRLKRPWIAMGLLQAGIGLFVMVGVRLLDRLPDLYLRFMAWQGLTWPAEMQAKFLLSTLVMLPPTLLSGAVWPVAVRLAAPAASRVASAAGSLYAANTAGSIAGSLAGAFLLLPILGMQWSLLAVSLLLVACGVWFCIAEPVPRRTWFPAVSLILIAVCFTHLGSSAWDRRVMTSGAYFMPRAYLDDNNQPVLRERLREMRLLYYAEGVTTTPAVAILGDINKAFFNDGKIEGATALDGMRLQRMLGHLPFVLRERPAQLALNIGLGSGITVGAMGVHRPARLDCAEIEPVVVQAARLFDPESFSVLDRPELRLIYNDGRNHLMVTPERYDAISSAPFAPLVGGAASLYSLEHFRLVRDRLAPGGLTAQFLPLYQLAPRDYRTIMRTFAEVFPDATVWFTGVETILIGGAGPLRIDWAALAAGTSDVPVAVSLRQIGLEDPARLLATYCFRVSDVAYDLRDAPLNTDDQPLIEFSAPRSHLTNTVRENLAWVAQRRRDPRGEDGLLAGLDAASAARLDRSLDVQRMTIEGRLKILSGDLDGGIVSLDAAARADGEDLYARDLLARNLVKLAEQLTAQKRPREAVAAYRRALEWDQHQFLALYNLAWFAWQGGDAAAARRLTDRALAQAPHSPSLNYRMGLILSNAGEHEGALHYLRQAIAADPHSPDTYLVMGDVFHAQGDHETSAIYYDAAIREGKRDAESHAALAGELVDLGRMREAGREIERALRGRPGHPEALLVRARINLSAGQREPAARDLADAVRDGGEPIRQRALADPKLRELLGGE